MEDSTTTYREYIVTFCYEPSCGNIVSILDIEGGAAYTRVGTGGFDAVVKKFQVSVDEEKPEAFVRSLVAEHAHRFTDARGVTFCRVKMPVPLVLPIVSEL